VHNHHTGLGSWRLGYFAKLGDVPVVVVEHVRGVLGRPETVIAETDVDRTAKRHQQFVA
jgi:hypothetical protein